MNEDQLVTTAFLAERWGVEIGTAWARVNDERFPDPAEEVAGAKTWRLGDVIEHERTSDQAARWRVGTRSKRETARL